MIVGLKVVTYLSTLLITLYANFPPSSLNSEKDKKYDSLFTTVWHLRFFLSLKWVLFQFAAFKQILPVILYHFNLPVIKYFNLTLIEYVHTSTLLDEGLSPYETLFFAMAIVGGLLRIWCFRTLGHLFTFQIGIRQRHKLIASGPYRYLLHPSYTGTILNTFGFLLLSQIPLWILLPYSIFFFSFITRRIKEEEEMLAKYFGELWTTHKATRWRLLPFVY